VGLAIGIMENPDLSVQKQVINAGYEKNINSVDSDVPFNRAPASEPGPSDGDDHCHISGIHPHSDAPTFITTFGQECTFRTYRTSRQTEAIMTQRSNPIPRFENKCILILLLLLLFSTVFAHSDLQAQTWQRMKMELPSGYDRISNQFATFAFVTKDIGWLNAWVEDSATRQTKAKCLFKTTNGGDNWFVQRNFGLRSYGRNVLAIDTNHLWVGLSYSTDGGNTWPDTVSTHPKRLDFTELFFFDSLSGVAVGTIPGTTTDGGRTWTSHDSIPEALYPTKLSFPTRTQGWAACEGHPGISDAGSIIYTSDGGATWAFQYPPLQRSHFSQMYSVEFLDSLTGFAVGGGEVLWTTNGGVTWAVKPNAPRGGDISFISDRVGCLTGGYGRIWRTNDRGMTWIADTTENSVGYAKLFPIKKEGYFFAWGYRTDRNHGVLLRGDFRSLTMVEEEAIVPEGNPAITINTYPNPFYDDVTMDMHGPAGRDIRISVRDLLGREVYREDASIPHSGVYTLRWRPSGYHMSSATYVVTVSSKHSVVSAIAHHMKYIQ